jgi:hypothetical protein
MRPFRDVSMVFGHALPGRGASVNVPARRQAGRLHVSKVIHGNLQGILTPGSLGAFPALQAMEALLYAARSRTLFASFLGSSAVEHSTVNRMVAGSNPARGAIRLLFAVLARSQPFITPPQPIVSRSLSADPVPPRFGAVRTHRPFFGGIGRGYRRPALPICSF